MKYSMMTYTMAIQGHSVEDFIKTAVKLKMDGIDWVTTYGEDPQELKQRCDDAGLPVVAYTFFLGNITDLNKMYLETVKRSLEDAAALGAPVVMIPPVPPEGISSRSEGRSIWIRVLKEIMPLAKDAGIVLTIENFPGLLSPFITADDFFEAQAHIPELRLTFDNGNAATGEDQINSMLHCMDSIVHVHLKDWDFSSEPKDSYRQMLNGYYRPALIGEGVVDSKTTVRELERAGYTGFVNIEYENKKYPAEEAIKMALEYLRK